MSNVLTIYGFGVSICTSALSTKISTRFVYVFRVIATINSDCLPIKHLILVVLMEACCVLCEVRTESLYDVYISCSHQRLKRHSH